MTILIRRYSYSNDGEEKTVSEFSLPTLYFNSGLEYSDVQHQSKLVYKAILDGNLDIRHTDKIVVDNKEYLIRSLNLVQYEGIKYIHKLESEAT